MKSGPYQDGTMKDYCTCISKDFCWCSKYLWFEQPLMLPRTSVVTIGEDRSLIYLSKPFIKGTTWLALLIYSPLEKAGCMHIKAESLQHRPWFFFFFFYQQQLICKVLTFQESMFAQGLLVHSEHQCCAWEPVGERLSGELELGRRMAQLLIGRYLSCTAKWFSYIWVNINIHMYASPFFFIFFSHGSFPDFEYSSLFRKWGFPDISVGNESACNLETLVWFLGQEDLLEKGEAIHSSICGFCT